ncbi:MAG: AAC(3) family N-acetyltransferase [Clostridia bacterium]|nr:AAC(3) family N-acetyltransferase [Clostridia bacterium]
MFTKEQLKRQITNMGIKSCDTVLIHTSYKSVGEVEGGIDGFIDAFKEYLCDGLFIIPTHTWDNVTKESPVFDVKTTIPCIGAVPAVAAFRKDGIRSLHPTHSVWAVGSGAEEFVKGEEFAETPAPVGGCWSRLADLGAKILLIGVGNNRNTFIHAVDEMANLDDRLAPKPWDITVVDYKGNKVTHPYRNHHNAGSENFGNFEKMFIAMGVQTRGKLGNADVKICDAKKCTDVLLKLYSRVRENLCLEEKDVPEELYLD